MSSFKVHPAIKKLQFEKTFGRIIYETNRSWFFISRNGNLFVFDRKAKVKRQISEDEENGFHLKTDTEESFTVRTFKEHVQDKLREAYSDYILLEEHGHRK